MFRQIQRQLKNNTVIKQITLLSCFTTIFLLGTMTAPDGLMAHDVANKAVSTAAAEPSDGYMDNEEKDDDEPSLPGRVFRFLGDILALPFNLIGNIFDAIF